MKRIWLSLGWLVVACFLASATKADERCSISGVIYDAGDHAMEGANVVLGNDQSLAGNRQTRSSALGRYQFDGLPAGEYHITVERAGYLVVKSGAIVLSAEKPEVSLDFKLLSIGLEAAAVPAQTPPKFESAGVRGLVDPGGYSAPANAAAASGLVKGMAELKRSANAGSVAAGGAVDCAVLPGLIAAVQSNPADANANRQLGEFYLAHGQAPRAIPYFHEVLQSDAKDVAAREDLATALLKTEQFAAARELLKSFSENEGQPEVHQLLARAEEGSGNFKQASLEYEFAAKWNPSEENLFGVGYELILAGSPADGAQAFESALERVPHSVLLLIGAGTAEFLLGKNAVCVRHLLQATEIDPADPRTYSFLAQFSGESGEDGQRILGSFKHYLELAPEDPRAAYDYALTLWNHRSEDPVGSDDSRVEVLLKRAIELDPTFARAHFQLANVYYQRSDFAAAATEFERSLQLDPGMQDVHYQLASAYKHIGQMEKSARELRLFEQSRESANARPGGDSISVAQFVSVIAPRGNANPGGSCPLGDR